MNVAAMLIMDIRGKWPGILSHKLVEAVVPIIEINLAEGRSVEMKRKLYQEVTSAVVRALGVPTEQVRIIVRDIPVENFAVAGVTKFEPVPKSMSQSGNPAEVVAATGE